MRSRILEIVSASALGIAALGATKIGLISHRAPQAASSVRPQAPSKEATKKDADATPCKSNACVDPAVQAGKFAKDEGEEDLKGTICDFLTLYGARQPNGSESSNSNSKKGRAAYCNNLTAIQESPAVAIAVLPDPVHSQLALRFDTSVDELQNSIADSGWFYDRSWLPWEGKEHSGDVDFPDRMKNRNGQEQYETNPGVILFRPDPDHGTSSPLVVLVVGDTPTGGVNSDQFRNAVKVIQLLAGLDDHFNGTSVDGDAVSFNILGPSFSGSIPSLKKLLRELSLQAGGKPGKTVKGDVASYLCPSRGLKINIASGTVSGARAISTLDSDLDGCATLEISAVSFEVDGNYRLVQILEFLRSHETVKSGNTAGASEIAILDEAESSFGASGAKSATGQSMHKEIDFEESARQLLNDDQIARIRLSELQEGGQRSRKGIDERQQAKTIAELQRKILPDDIRDSLNSAIPPGEREDILKIGREENALRLVTKVLPPKHFFFPREISRLRTAYEQGSIFGFNSESNSVHTELHLSFSGNTSQDDTVQSYSGPQGPAVLEAQMAQLASELDRQKIKIVILSATDVLDEIFVARYLGQHAPNVSVILTDSDDLFLRAGESSLLNAYVVVPWPLISGNEVWSSASTQPSDNVVSPPPVRIHENAGGEGVYAAARVLFYSKAKTSRKEPIDHSRIGDFLREYQAPLTVRDGQRDIFQSRPPLWLSVVGRGGFWPISLIDLDQVDHKLPLLPAASLPVSVAYSNLDHGELKESIPGSNGISEADSRSITLATCVIALLLLWHGFACIRARLDRGFAWSYASSDRAHFVRRLGLQACITLFAIPALVLLKIPKEAGIDITSPKTASINWTLQIFAALLATWPILQLAKALPWPTCVDEMLRAGMKLLVWCGFVIGYIVLLNEFLWKVISPSSKSFPSEHTFFLYRSGHLFCGSSPTLPILLLGGALVVYMISAFERMVFYKPRIPTLPECDEPTRCPSPEMLSPLNRLLSESVSFWKLVLLVGAVAMFLLFHWAVQYANPRSLAHGRLDTIVDLMSACVAVLLIFDLLMAIATWFLLLTDCLLPLGRSPLRWGFTWIKGWSWRRIWAPGAMSPQRVYDYLTRISEANLRAIKDQPLQDAFEALRATRAKSPRYADWAHTVTTQLGSLHEQLALSARQKLDELRKLWSQDFGPITGGNTSGGNTPERGLAQEVPLKPEHFQLTDQADMARWRESHDRVAKEEFVALLYLGYIRMVLLQIRNRILVASAMYVLLLWALTSYPFLNHHYILVGMISLLVVLAGSAVWIYSQMHRDDILSRTTETQSGSLDLDFFLKVSSIIGIPLLTLIATQFPEISNLVFSWLEPGLSSMK